MPILFSKLKVPSNLISKDFENFYHKIYIDMIDRVQVEEFNYLANPNFDLHYFKYLFTKDVFTFKSI